MVLLSLASPTMGTTAVELGSGYGSGARYLAANFGATVECVDLSLEANDWNRRLTEDAGLSHVVKVGAPATFFNTGLPGGSYGFCFSQDAMCHAGQQTPRALVEAARLLEPGGILACTNILRAEGATPEELDDVLVRLQLSHLETIESFAAHGIAAGMELVKSLDKTYSMVMHFHTLLEVRTALPTVVEFGRILLSSRLTLSSRYTLLTFVAEKQYARRAYVQTPNLHLPSRVNTELLRPSGAVLHSEGHTLMQLFMFQELALVAKLFGLFSREAYRSLLMKRGKRCFYSGLLEILLFASFVWSLAGSGLAQGEHGEKYLD